MRASHWWCALLLLGNWHLACADETAKEPATDDTPSMEVIEMLGDMDGEMVDLEIAMSDEKIDEKKIDEKPAAQEVKNAE